jgi:ribosomal protein S18 acetylase RimI-like enzyme
MRDGGIQIEEAVCADAEEILALQRRAYLSEAAIYDDYSLPPLLETLEEVRARFRDHLFLKAVAGDGAVTKSGAAAEGRIVGSVRAREKDEDSESSIKASSLQSQDSGLQTQDSGLQTQDSGLQTQDSGLQTQDSSLGSAAARQGGRVCHVARLIVDPAIQNQGLGTRLLLEVEARFPGARRFELFTGHKSDRNLYLYQKLGYRVWKTEFVHERLDLVYLAKARPTQGAA